MSKDLLEQFAAHLRQLIGVRPVRDLGDKDGPSKSYLYRMLKAETNPTLTQMDAVIREYGSTLGDFFDPWRQESSEKREQLTAEARILLDEILASGGDINGLVNSLRVLHGFAVGSGKPSKRKLSKKR